ncbi:hypothetical protein N9A60_01855 [Akkermansiaceae bacterium]|nr:hypothetical protein [Akkermansiaceae bacterium]
MMRYLLLPILLLSSCRQDKNTAEETQSNEPTGLHEWAMSKGKYSGGATR